MCEVCAFWDFHGCRYSEACPLESVLSWCVWHLSALRGSSVKYIPDCTANTSQNTVLLKSCFPLLMKPALSKRTSRSQIPLSYPVQHCHSDPVSSYMSEIKGRLRWFNCESIFGPYTRLHQQTATPRQYLTHPMFVITGI